jgi:hypothetical protein
VNFTSTLPVAPLVLVPHRPDALDHQHDVVGTAEVLDVEARPGAGAASRGESEALAARAGHRHGAAFLDLCAFRRRASARFFWRLLHGRARRGLQRLLIRQRHGHLGRLGRWRRHGCALRQFLGLHLLLHGTSAHRREAAVARAFAGARKRNGHDDRRGSGLRQQMSGREQDDGRQCDVDAD